VCLKVSHEEELEELEVCWGKKKCSEEEYLVVIIN
jgi:hypothetical protein